MAMTLEQDIRHLIYLDTQFDMRGETDLKWQEMHSLEARGWIAEGEENGEYVITEEGERVIAAHLTQPAQSVDVASVPTEFVEDIQRAERLAMKSKKLNRERMMGLAVVKHFGHLLTAALQEKGNG